MLSPLLHFLLLLLFCVQVCGKALPSSDTYEHTRVYAEESLGVMKGTIQHFDLPALPSKRSFYQNCAVYGAKAAGYVGAKVIFEGSDALRDLHKEAAHVVIQSLCADLCKDIGAAYNGLNAAGQVVPQTLDYFSHKLMHAFIGAMGQAVKGPQAMLAGAAGGALGEILGEHLASVSGAIDQVKKDNPILSPHDGACWHALVMEQMKDQHDRIQALTGAIAAFMGLDGYAAKDAAQIALENNNFLAMPFLVMLGLIEACVLNPQAVQALLRNAQILYKVGKDVQNKGQQQVKDKADQKQSGEGEKPNGDDPGDQDPKDPNNKWWKADEKQGARFDNQKLYHKKGVRLEAENPKPAERPGQIHVHTKGGKFNYNIDKKVFYDQKNPSNVVPGYVKDLLKDPKFLSAIHKGLKYLGVN